MQYLTDPIAFILKWTFDFILVPIGELPNIINPNYIFLAIGFIGLIFWLNMQYKYNKKADREGTLQ